MKKKKDSVPKADKPCAQFYSGYKSHETPRSIIIGEKEYPIKKITEQKRITDFKSGERYNLFVCETENKTYSIKVFDSGKTDKVDVYKGKKQRISID